MGVDGGLVHCASREHGVFVDVVCLEIHAAQNGGTRTAICGRSSKIVGSSKEHCCQTEFEVFASTMFNDERRRGSAQEN